MPMFPVVTVFIQNGCGACHAFMPVFHAVVDPFRTEMDVHVVNISTHAGQALANRWGIQATPTTLVQTRRNTEVRRVGAIEPRALQALLAGALR
jgi:thiol-disulfide isomerase/thioredoxin